MWIIGFGDRLPRLDLAVGNTAGTKEGKRELSSLPQGVSIMAPKGRPHFCPVALLVCSLSFRFSDGTLA